jgi:hypothetical protein
MTISSRRTGNSAICRRFSRAANVVVCRLGAVEHYHDAIRLARHELCFDPYRQDLVRTLLILLALDERRCEGIYLSGLEQVLEGRV